MDISDPQIRLAAVLAESISVLDLNIRVTNSLEAAGILTIRDLLMRRPEELLSIDHFGEKTLIDVYAALNFLGFRVPRRLPKVAGGRKANQAALRKSPDLVLDRCIRDLMIVVNNLLDENQDNPHAANLLWVISYCRSRQLPPDAEEEAREFAELVSSPA